ncbi:MAG: tyrosine recombinase XerC [Prevotellaceae bacterium]|jgi:integrase/recombinase XerC|nr:tyrosine recombinase XerC [Prevotellaceae bacterium]
MWLTKSFLDYLLYERNYSKGTIRYYEDDIRQFEAFAREEIGDSTPDVVKAELVREWIISLMDKGYASSTINKKLSSLRSFYRFLLQRGELTVDPLQKVTGPKKKKPLPVFLKESDMDRLLDETDFGDGYQGCRDHLIIEVFYTAGLRVAELIGLDDRHVDFAASQLKVTGKGNKQRLIPFGEELEVALKAYVEVRNEAIPLRSSDAFFVQENGKRLTYYVVAKLVKQNLSKVVTQKKRSPHVLRHTFATTMLNHNAELGAIKELLGHASLATTEVYTHTTFEELKKVYNQAHPRV